VEKVIWLKGEYMKKILKLAVLFLAILAVGLFGIYLHNFSVESFKSGSVNDIVSAIENEEILIAYYGQEECSACKVFAENLKDVSKRFEKEVMYLDANSLNVEDEKFLIEYYVTETPTLIIVNKGTPYFYRNITTKDEMENALTNVNIIKERFEGLISIDYVEVEQKMEKGLDFFLYIGREDCRDCVKFNPLLVECIGEKENQGVYYLDIKKYRDLAKAENAKKEDTEFYDAIKEKFDITWVPSVYHIRNGMIIAKYEFLDEGYYEMEKELQEKEEQYYIEKLYDWIETEFK